MCAGRDGTGVVRTGRGRPAWRAAGLEARGRREGEARRSRGREAALARVDSVGAVARAIVARHAQREPHVEQHGGQPVRAVCRERRHGQRRRAGSARELPADTHAGHRRRRHLQPARHQFHDRERRRGGSRLHRVRRDDFAVLHRREPGGLSLEARARGRAAQAVRGRRRRLSAGTPRADGRRFGGTSPATPGRSTTSAGEPGTTSTR